MNPSRASRRLAAPGSPAPAAVSAIALALLLFGAARAYTATVVSAGDGNWDAGGTWSGGIAPQPGDDVAIQTGHTVTLTGLTAQTVKSLSITGTLTHAANSTTEAHKIDLDIQTDLTIADGGVIDVTRRGYASGQGPGASSGNRGASHGGAGGVYSFTVAPGATYGAVTAPVNLGSGGNGTTAQGGGAVILRVGATVTLLGSISADGGPNGGGNGGSGAGGSVFITAGAVDGAGTITAHGPDTTSGYSGGGGGGRIALVVTNATSIGAISPQAYGGKGAHNGVPNDGWGAGAGTIFVKTQADSHGTLLVDNHNQPRSRPYITMVTGGGYTFDLLVTTNRGILEIGTGTVFNLTQGGDVRGSPDTRLIIGEGALTPPSPFVISNAVISFAGHATRNWTSDVTVAAAGVLTHEANGSTEAHQLILSIDGNLTVSEGGRIDVTGCGYSANQGPGKPAGGNDGGGHGGEGGVYNNVGGPPYGSIVAPTNIGSGGGGRAGGGSVVLMVAGSVTNNGLIAADGRNGDGGGGGGGAGGSVFIQADNVEGTGLVRANGSRGHPSWSGGGAGGRIAIVLAEGSGFGEVGFQAYGGPGGSVGGSQAGAAGTVFMQSAMDTYGALIVGNSNRVVTATTLINSNVSDRSVDDVMLRSDARMRIVEGQTLTVHGSWSNAASTAGLSGGGNVEFAGSATAHLHGSTTFGNFTCQTPGKTLRFQDGHTFVTTAGLTLAGADGNLLALESTDPGSQFNFRAQAGSTQHDVSYLSVRDSNANGGDAIIAMFSEDEGNNDNWIFSNPEPIVWTGGAGNSLWTEPANWDPARMPLQKDPSITIAPAGDQPALDISRSFNGELIVQSGATLNLNGNDLSMGGNITVAGTLTAVGSETLTAHANVSCTGTINPAQSTLRLNGEGPQNVSAGGSRFHAIELVNTGLVTFAEAFTAHELTFPSTRAMATFVAGFAVTNVRVSVSEGAALTFAAGQTYEIENQFLLRGVPEHPVVLTVAGVGAWNLNVHGYAAVRFVDVSDSDAAGGIPIRAVNSTNSGNNENWYFDVWKVWTGATGSVFFDDANWDPVGAPDAADGVCIDAGYDSAPVLATPATIAFLMMGFGDGASLTLNAPLTVGGEVQIGPGAVVTHADNATAVLYRLDLTASGRLIVAEGGSINVTGGGYNANTGPGRPAGGNDGGGHGGEGGRYNNVGGPPYGSIVAPTNMGSGGGNGRGGGVVRLTIDGKLIVNGLIAADGNRSANNNGGGSGAGGSIYIQSAAIEGNGVIQANGGGGYPNVYTGGGAGGRVAVVLTNATDFGGVHIVAFGGPGGTGSGEYGAAGSVYLRRAGDDYGELYIDNSNRVVTATTEMNSNVLGRAVGDVFILRGAKLRMEPDQSLTVHGSWSNAATFASLSGGTVEFAGTDAANVWGNTTWQNLTIATHGKRVHFEAGATQTINGTPTFENVVWLLSTAPGSQWNLIKPGVAGDEQPVGAVVVQDSDARGGRTFVAGLGSASLGNNLNWIFPPRGSIMMVR